MVYSTVNVRHLREKIPKQLVLKILQDQENRYLTSYQLAKILNIKVDNTNVGIKKIITELIEEDLEPIIADDKGFQYTIDRKKIDAYVESLNGRISGINKRVVALTKIRNKL